MDDGTSDQEHGSATTERAGDGLFARKPESLTQDEVSEVMFRARTLEQCAEAWKAQAEYLREHPEDESVIEEGEALWMHEQALKNTEAQKQAERAAACSLRKG